jgi:hypothetical protein
MTAVLNPCYFFTYNKMEIIMPVIKAAKHKPYIYIFLCSRFNFSKIGNPIFWQDRILTVKKASGEFLGGSCGAKGQLWYPSL